MQVYLQTFSIIILEVLCYKIFVETFNKRRFENKKWAEWITTISLVIILFAVVVVLNEHIILKCGISTIFMGLAAFTYLKVSRLKAIILSILYQGLLLTVDYLVLILHLNIFGSMKQVQSSYYLESILMVILGKVVLFIIILVIKNYFIDESVSALSDTEWIRFLYFPIFTIFTIVAMITTRGDIQSQRQGDALWAIAFCLAIMNIVVFYLIYDIMQREKKLYESNIFKLQVKSQTNSYHTVSENYEKQRKKTHEYKNQIMCIESLVKKKSYQELEKYVETISGKLTQELDCIQTNNVIVDAILNSKYQEIVEKKILFVFKINDLSNIVLNDEDTVIILSNLLDNAIEACDKCTNKKMIKVKFVSEEGNIIISVKNTYERDIVIVDGNIKTSKKYHSEEHGIGIQNIIGTIEKYGGSYTINNDNKEFVFSIVIPG